MCETCSKLKKSYAEGFEAAKLLDNTNVYGVLFSESCSNIFISSLWQKVLNPYTLFLSGGDKLVVGNNITISGLTRAVVGVFAGRTLIDRFGADTTMAIAGMFGIVGLCINKYVILHNSVHAIYAVNLVWAVFSGLWNSALETIWARSVLKEKRNDVNSGRQVLNKLTTALGPLFSIAVILYVGGKTWTVPMMQDVMEVGTALSSIVVILCFLFNRSHEINQRSDLVEIRTLEFPDNVTVPICTAQEEDLLQKADFQEEADGPVHITYPLSRRSQFGKLRVLTKDLKESGFILGKQIKASFKGVESSVARGPCIIHFVDESRAKVVATLEEVMVYLREGEVRKVDRKVSFVMFKLIPTLRKQGQNLFCRGFSKLFLCAKTEIDENDLAQLGVQQPLVGKDGTFVPKQDDKRSINMTMANVIVFCDVLNAVGSGMSLKFMDLFLIQDYGVSPITLLSLACIQNLSVVFLTPQVKSLMSTIRLKGGKGALGVSFYWAISLFFLGLICIPNQNFYVAVVSIVLMNSLSSCTKAYNRSKLVDSLPPQRVANYMVWDSLNKANQGGIAIFGGQVSAVWGYRGCFVVTFFILLLRWLVWTIYLAMRGCRRRKAIQLARMGTQSSEFSSFHRENEEDIDRQTMKENEFESMSMGTLDFDKAESELFQPTIGNKSRVRIASGLLMVQEEDGLDEIGDDVETPATKTSNIL